MGCVSVSAFACSVAFVYVCVSATCHMHGQGGQGGQGNVWSGRCMVRSVSTSTMHELWSCKGLSKGGVKGALAPCAICSSFSKTTMLPSCSCRLLCARRRLRILSALAGCASVCDDVCCMMTCHHATNPVGVAQPFQSFFFFFLIPLSVFALAMHSRSLPKVLLLPPCHI